MKPEHHRMTASYGGGEDAESYRALQQRLIKEGRWRDAFKMDVQDVERIEQEIGEPGKYREAIAEAREYLECLEENGLL